MIEEITAENARQYLVKLFAKVGKEDTEYRTNTKHLTCLSEMGAQIFKRRALGFCGHTSIKSLEEFAELLVKTNIAPSIEEAEALVPRVVFANKLSPCAIHMGRLRYITFNEVRSSAGDTKYRITAWTVS
jgi:hypothetical protein